MAGLYPAVIALIGAAAFVVGRNAVNDLPAALFTAGCLLLLFYTRLHPLIYIGAGAVFGLIFYL